MLFLTTPQRPPPQLTTGSEGGYTPTNLQAHKQKNSFIKTHHFGSDYFILSCLLSSQLLPKLQRRAFVSNHTVSNMTSFVNMILFSGIPCNLTCLNSINLNRRCTLSESNPYTKLCYCNFFTMIKK